MECLSNNKRAVPSTNLILDLGSEGFRSEDLDHGNKYHSRKWSRVAAILDTSDLAKNFMAPFQSWEKRLKAVANAKLE